LLDTFINESQERREEEEIQVRVVPTHVQLLQRGGKRTAALTPQTGLAKLASAQRNCAALPVGLLAYWSLWPTCGACCCQPNICFWRPSSGKWCLALARGGTASARQRADTVPVCTTGVPGYRRLFVALFAVWVHGTTWPRIAHGKHKLFSI
jgi:hypothetical protein